MMENLREILQVEERDLFRILREKIPASYTITEDENCFLVKKPDEETRIMLAGNISETKCLVTGTKENRAEVVFFGNIHPAAWLGTKMRSENGHIGILRSEKKTEIKADDLYLDFGVSCAKDILPGHVFSFHDKPVLQNNSLFGSGLSGKIGGAILLETVCRFAEKEQGLAFALMKNTFLGTFAAEQIVAKYKPDILMTVLGYPAGGHFSLGKGAGILLKDGSAVVGEKMRRQLIETAEKAEIPTQLYIGKRDMQNEKMSVAGGGTCLGGICLPVEGMGEPIEIMSFDDIEKSINLLLKVIPSL